MKIEHYEKENELNIPEGKTTMSDKCVSQQVNDEILSRFLKEELMRGKEILEQVDDEILNQFLSEIEKTFNVKILKAKCSQIFSSLVFFGAAMELRLEISELKNDVDNVTVVLYLSANDCKIIMDQDVPYHRLKKIWRKVLLTHFREQVTPYLQEEKERKQKEIEDEQKELEEEFTFDGTKL